MPESRAQPCTDDGAKKGGHERNPALYLERKKGGGGDGERGRREQEDSRHNFKRIQVPAALLLCFESFRPPDMRQQKV
eukprot:1158086-Pelagomonas_calceolata.AAC.18